MSSAVDALPPELDFLRPYLPSNGPRYQSADWLTVDFDDEVWTIRCDTQWDIDWRVPIGQEGELLTSKRHRPLWTIFRSWLIVQTHPDLTGGKIHSPTTVAMRLRYVVRIIDYFIINAQRFQLAEYGLSLITRNDVQSMLAGWAGSRKADASIYDWPGRLTKYLRVASSHLTAAEIANVLSEAPFLAQDVPESTSFLTSLSPDEVLRVRVWAWTQNRYREASWSEFRYILDIPPIVAALYGGTLLGKGNKGFPHEFALLPGYRISTEFPAAPVVADTDSRMLGDTLAAYVAALRSIDLLRGQGMDVPVMRRILPANVRAGLQTKEKGRYRTLPHQSVLFALRRAIEFALDYGEGLLLSFSSLAAAASNAGQSVTVYANANDISSHLDPTTVSLGVRNWTIEPFYSYFGVTPDAPSALTRDEFYRKLRASHGLFEAILVLYGAIQIAVGTLMARRQGELMDLFPNSCLDQSRTRLVFANRKSGVAGYRELEARPIPTVAVSLIDQIIGMQDRLLSQGVIQEYAPLFARPTCRGERVLTLNSAGGFNTALDYFCDYVEMPLNRNGERYYIRQHQLRRFFCMLFMWGSGTGGLDTLRHFLGHINAEHLWNYITETTPGAVIQGIKAQWAAEAIRGHYDGTSELESVLQQELGVSRFELLDADELTNHIEDLVESGQVTIEPHFLDAGRRYQIAITVRPLEAT